MNLSRLLTKRSAIGESRVERQPLDLAVAPGEAILKIDRVAITSNNMTYATYGDSMQYWNFFPAGVDGWALTPVWGFADVVASAVPGLAVGERYYGFFPIASHLRVKPGRVSARGFTDEAEHRLALPVLYNQYLRTSADAAYRADREALQTIVRPLFITAFVLADFLADNAYFDARQVIISSASSKTAFGTAFCLKEQGGVQTVGLTSARNKAFVEGLGCYDRVVAYEDIASLDGGVPSVYVDFSGDVGLRRRVHEHFIDTLRYNALIGSTLGVQFARDATLPGPRPTFFFAPTQIKRRSEQWGAEVFTQKFNAVQERFIERAGSDAAPWIRIEEHRGIEAGIGIIADLVGGRVAPDAGHVVLID